jgi:hypothetical protein
MTPARSIWNTCDRSSTLSSLLDAKTPSFILAADLSCGGRNGELNEMTVNALEYALNRTLPV